jgi:hypothetical protein
MKKTKLTLFDIKKVKRILSWVSYYWFPKVTDAVKITDLWITQIQYWHEHSGPIWTIGRVKDLRLTYTRYVCGIPFSKTEPFPGRLGLYPRGLPKATPYFNTLIEEGGIQNISFVLTLLSLSRIISGTKNPDLSTITNPSSKDNSIINELEDFLGHWFKLNGIKTNNEYQWSPDDLRLVNKAGPEGRSTLFSWRDAVVIPENLYTSICSMNDNLKLYLSELRNRHPVDKVIKAHQRLKGQLPEIHYTITQGDKIIPKVRGYEERVAMYEAEHKDLMNIRKLSIVEDPEAKARIIAIFDYWSQTALRPIHDLQFKILANLPCDRTFTQNPIITDKEDGHSYWSIDLTAATDRFPVEIQKTVVKYLFNQTIADAWQSILIDYDFYVPWSNERVYYNSGQPMGAYSSWSTFSICHHIVVAYAASKVERYNGRQFRKYILLGDDIVLYDDDVAKHYIEIMKRLGVETSPHKTHVSKTTYEFAKRWFNEGKEVTGIQVRGLLEVMNKYHLLYQAIITLYERGQHPRVAVSIPSLLMSLIRRSNTFSRMRGSLRIKIMNLHAFSEYAKSGKTEKLIERIKELYPDSWITLPNNEEDLNHWIRTYIYMSADRIIQRLTAENLDYSTGLLQGNYMNRFGPALADSSHILISPVWLILQSSLTRAVINRLRDLGRSLISSMNDGSIRSLVQTISLPEPSMLEQRNSVRIANATAELADRYFRSVEDHVMHHRPPHVDINLSHLIVSNAYDRLNNQLLNSEKYKYNLPF